MDEYELNEVLEYADDLRREWSSKEDVDAFNNAVMRLRDAADNIDIIDSFDDIREEE